jgi:DNA polymerase-3 subunit gamma/tau
VPWTLSSTLKEQQAVFENLLGQEAFVGQIRQDIETGSLAPSLLFAGPPASGKGTAALELARVLSCEAGKGKRGAWNCQCPSCAKQRYLAHGDLLLMGSRPFSAEIFASAAAWERGSVAGGNKPPMLFIRALRGLLLRFNPALWEDDPKASKLAPLVEALDSGVDELMRTASYSVKLRDSLVKDALKLEAEGISAAIAAAQVRNAAWWCRTAPIGLHKTLVIENAEKMQDAARNSLLKLLEEPPDGLTIILTSTRSAALLQTIRSRLRPYHFVRRSAASEAEIERRVFHDAGARARTLTLYLDSFLPLSRGKLRTLAQDFYRGLQSSAPTGPLVQAVAAGCGKFEDRADFSRFMAELLDLLGESLADSVTSPEGTANLVKEEKLRRLVGEAVTACGTYNQNPVLVLESLVYNYRKR